ncbi:hypothetical protein [Actinoplanes sp. NBRC 101535]|uniref:hypothetical protein n=1 Tax=Actinoplanes sp. NBRC 101535 TaxID=3032196 RepID=UPI0024A0A709|nr:hypothetical protein [Actinoplanes sp. NBRC 101535]GLY08226.1 hypothetical protein Acsp01_86050 [Actinoplanes sp. NBRC 101535]
MPVHVTETLETPDGPRYLADPDTLAALWRDNPDPGTRYSATTIRMRCRPDKYDPRTGRALYDQTRALETLRETGVIARPHTQGVSRNRTSPRRRTR